LFSIYKTQKLVARKTLPERPSTLSMKSHANNLGSILDHAHQFRFKELTCNFLKHLW